MDTIDEKTIRENKKINRRLIVMYKALASDLIFYYTISYLFLVNVKGLTTAQVVFADSFYPIFKLIFQLPCTMLIQKIGKRNSLIISNISLAIYLLFIIGLVNTTSLIIANIFCAFSFVIKGMAESNLLYDSLEKTSRRRENFSKMEGQSMAYYYLIEAITSILAGFLFAVNAYIPMYLSLGVVIISIIINFALKEIPDLKIKQTNKESTSIYKEFKTYILDLKDGFKFILKSKRLISLILFNAIFASVLNIAITMRRSLLNDINVSSSYFGIIFTILGLIAFYSSTKTLYLHKTLKNKALTVLGLLYCISLVLSGVLIIYEIPHFFRYYLILIMFSVQYYIKGPYFTLIKQYYNSFSTSDIRLKIYSASAIIEFSFYSIMSFGCSYLLSIYTNAMTAVIFGGISLIVIGILLFYMRKHVGLKPEEYSKNDVFVID